jgi:16S rRNA (guanine966-N2)-methyltransferase
VPVPAGVRPTEARVREALFSIWAPRLPGARFLDLFAGSGAVSLEAAGRGAGRVLAVEGDRRIAARLRESMRTLGAAVEVRQADLPAGLEGALASGERFDLVFVDPPYDSKGHEITLARLCPYVEPGGEVALEMSVRSAPAAPPAQMERVAERRYGETALLFYRRK